MRRVLLIWSLLVITGGINAQDKMPSAKCVKAKLVKGPIQLRTDSPISYQPGVPEFSVDIEASKKGSKPLKKQERKIQSDYSLGRAYNGGMPGSTAPIFRSPLSPEQVQECMVASN